MADIVQKQKMAFIWIPGLLPFHVTNISKFKISCPQKFRKYASRVEETIPIFEEEFTISNLRICIMLMSRYVSHPRCQTKKRSKRTSLTFLLRIRKAFTKPT